MYTQYIPAESPIHRLSAIRKLYGLAGFILLSFAVRSLPAALIYLAAALVLFRLSELPSRAVFRRLRHINILLTAGLIFNLFFTGWMNALTIFLRLFAIVLTSQVVIMSTRSLDLIDGLERGFRMKSSDVISVMIAIVFIPILEDTWKEILMAQSARGYDWNECSLREKFKGLGALLIPLFRFSAKKAEILGEALTIKEYHSEKKISQREQAP